MSTNFYIGQRLSFDGALCTVRYRGPLPNAKGEWLGVEWDKVDRGKHDGSHKGQRIFHCLSRSPTAGSFIRPTRQADSTCTALEALEYKYGSKSASNDSIQHETRFEADLVHISGKAVEEIGFEKIRKQIGRFQELNIVLLDGLNVHGPTADDDLDEAEERESEQLAHTCPNITELDLGWNLFEDWEEVVDICGPLLQLKVLKASGLRLAPFSFMARAGVGAALFSNVEELHLNETLLRPEQTLHILNWAGQKAFPMLKTLSLSLNELSDFLTCQPDLTFHSVNNLILDNNAFTDFSALPSIFHHFPSLTTLSLQGNQVSTIGSLRPDATFPTLKQLSLADNAISTFAFLSRLPQLFPSLISLRVSKNTLSTTLPPSAPSDATYYLTLARIPSLQTLNYTAITTRDREEGEIYYLSIAEKDIKSIISTQGLEIGIIHTKEHYSRYAELCTKYERPNILLDAPSPPTPTKGPQYPPNSLASRVVHCTFYIPSSLAADSKTTSSGTLTWTRSIPKTINVYTLKSLVHRHFGLAPLQFGLVYESPELDPIPETTRKMWDSNEDWERWGDFDVDIPPPGTSPKLRDEEDMEGKWIEGVLYRNGAKWKRRETEIVDGMRAWGDFLDGGEKEARIRVEPRNREWERGAVRWRNEDAAEQAVAEKIV